MFLTVETRYKSQLQFRLVLCNAIFNLKPAKSFDCETVFNLSQGYAESAGNDHALIRKGKKNASAGNRTRGPTMATLDFTTKPPMLVGCKRRFSPESH